MAHAPDSQPDRLLTEIAGLDRESCLTRLRAIRRPQLDFTERPDALLRDFARGG